MIYQLENTNTSNNYKMLRNHSQIRINQLPSGCMGLGYVFATICGIDIGNLLDG
jgi:hypothetical protein